ncbi:R3H and coiled-coil domain-containing protein 1 [Linnemannia zychae]|nr:R3H and coiled-coil domain-containing protein 1 [Linnemannia zychae]
MDVPPQNQPRGSGRNGGNNSNNNSGGDGANRRLPKVDVYIPRHRRGNDDVQPSESNDSRQSSTASSPRQTTTSTAPRNTVSRGNSNYSAGSGWDDGTEDTSSPSRSGNSSSSSDVQRRGRGKFMGPGTKTTGGGGGSNSGGGNNSRGGRDRDPRGSGSNSVGASRNTNNSRNGAYSNDSSSSSSSSQQQSPATQAPLAPRHPPRGRDFDATVLRRYSDDENRPNSSFSRSSSYTSTRSNNNQVQSSSTYTRSSTRTQDAASRRPDRSEEGNWRREVPKTTETMTAGGSGSADGKDPEPDLTTQFERVRLSAPASASTSRSGSADGTESADEPEEWELALQNSDDDGIPAAPKETRRHPAEHLLTSPSSTPSKIGNWSEVSNDDMYILELYDFSASIKTAHLTDMFAAFENRSGGFRIKWVDETKALVIFESASVAKQAYIANLTNQIAKIKPYNGPDKDSIRNAGNPSSGAYNGVRPAKTDSVARRLVQGALGLRVRRTPEQIAEEKAQIQAAKDARDAQRQEERRQRQEEERQRQAMDDVFNS